MEVLKQIERIVSWLNRYKERTNCKGVVLGLSGGKDSTVVAMLAKKVWGDNVMALLMPQGEQKDIGDSLEIAKSLNLNYRIVNIETIVNALKHVVELKLETDENGERDYYKNCPPITEKARTNIPPRIRMTVLYAVAQSMGYRVIGTGNLSESYIGWTTKWGDSACDFNPIAHLTCTEVVELGKHLAKEYGLDCKFVTKTPSDGLCGKTDEESFGFSYATLDDWIRNPMWNGIDYYVASKIEDMNEKSEHKRTMPLTVLDNIL